MFLFAWFGSGYVCESIDFRLVSLPTNLFLTQSSAASFLICGISLYPYPVPCPSLEAGNDLFCISLLVVMEKLFQGHVLAISGRTDIVVDDLDQPLCRHPESIPFDR